MAGSVIPAETGPWPKRFGVTVVTRPHFPAPTPRPCKGVDRAATGGHLTDRERRVMLPAMMTPSVNRMGDPSAQGEC